MAWLTGKRFSPRPSPVPVVKAYSNAKKVGLYVDEKFIGYGKKSGTVFIWENVNISGRFIHKIRAVAEFSDEKYIDDEAVWVAQNDEPA